MRIFSITEKRERKNVCVCEKERDRKRKIKEKRWREKKKNEATKRKFVQNIHPNNCIRLALHSDNILPIMDTCLNYCLNQRIFIINKC